MRPTFELAQDLYTSGRHAELLERHRDVSIDTLPSLEHRLLVALALLFGGEPDRATHIATTVGAISASSRERSLCELIHGLAAKRAGTLDRAIAHFQSAVRFADDAEDREAAAWAQLHLLRVMIGARSRDVLAALLLQVRQSVMHCGNPHLLAFLHDTVAVMEGQIGRIGEARRHLETCLSLLVRYPNAWLKQLAYLNHACVAHLECNFPLAVQYVREGRKYASITGNVYARTALDSNEAYVELLTGNFLKARHAFQTLRQSPLAIVRLTALEGLARLQLANSELEAAQQTLDEIDGSRCQPAIALTYPTRWSVSSRVKVLLRRGAAAAALETVDRELRRLAVVHDRPLSALVLLLKAQALASLGRLHEAAEALADAGHFGARATLEQLGDLNDISGRVLEYSGCPGARQLRDRAHRIWRHQGNVLAQTEAQVDGTDARPPDGVSAQSVAPAGLIGARERAIDPAVFSVINAVASVFELATDPDLMSVEVQTILDAAGVGGVADVTASGDAPPDARSSVAFENTNKTMWLRQRTIGSPEQAVLVDDVGVIARAATQLERLTRAERSRAALWPKDDIPANGTLFISEAMESLAATARKVAPTNVPVLITGETGTGKEILARLVHAASNRAKAVFLPFNCSAGPRDMIDAQMFGHRRGAFTGAIEHAPGIVRAAAGGTLFLDEVGEAPGDIQPKLLRFLESGEIHPVGEPHPLDVDVRVIAATNVDLDEAVASGRFREDLFYRLNIVRLHVPPLRERRVEIPVFAQHFLRKHAVELGKGDLRLAEETMEYLLLYKWPGNVRQLANEMRRLAALAETDAVLMPEHLSADIVASRRTVPASERTLDTREVVVRMDQPLAAATEHLERAMLMYAFEQCGGRVEETARALGLSRKGLYLKRLRLGLETPEPQARTA